MVTIKSFTSLEQSKKLAEILPLESADMKYPYFGNAEWGETPRFGEPIEYSGNKDKPCWSLASLLDILPFPQLSKDKLGRGKVGWMVSVYPNNCRYDSCWHDNTVDACVAMVEKLYKLKML